MQCLLEKGLLLEVGAYFIVDAQKYGAFRLDTY